jgi:glycosyltransferase involved in cell wall biosynthesis
VFRPSFPAAAFAEIPPARNFSAPFRVMFAGRIEQNKGVFDILEIAEKLREKGRPIEFTLCGDGGALEAVEKAIVDRQAHASQPRPLASAAVMTCILPGSELCDGEHHPLRLAQRSELRENGRHLLHGGVWRTFTQSIEVKPKDHVLLWIALEYGRRVGEKVRRILAAVAAVNHERTEISGSPQARDRADMKRTALAPDLAIPA